MVKPYSIAHVAYSSDIFEGQNMAAGIIDATLNSTLQGIQHSVKNQLDSLGSGVKGRSFHEVLAKTANPKTLQEVAGFDVRNDIEKVQDLILKGKNIPAEDLLIYQIRFGQYNLRVELVSKLAESATSSIKKFQTGQ